jgi:hypothetical protein
MAFKLPVAGIVLLAQLAYMICAVNGFHPTIQYSQRISSSSPQFFRIGNEERQQCMTRRRVSTMSLRESKTMQSPAVTSFDGDTSEKELQTSQRSLAPYVQQEQYLKDTRIDNESELYSSFMSYFKKLDEWYTVVNSKIRCPFLKRRISDIIDGLAMMGRFLVIRHKSVLSDPSFAVLLGYEYTVPGCFPLHIGGKSKVNANVLAGKETKLKNQSLETIENLIRQDWLGKHPSGTKGYYLTGKLSSQIYRNDCFFDGPDPDMPVRGLRKYLSAASHLFDQGKSHAEMLSIQRNEEEKTVTVTWLLGGVLMLPWRPKVQDWTGSTKYFLDEEGLIYKHQEQWDISVWEAFVSTAFPGFGHMVWGGTFPFLQ